MASNAASTPTHSNHTTTPTTAGPSTSTTPASIAPISRSWPQVPQEAAYPSRSSSARSTRVSSADSNVVIPLWIPADCLPGPPPQLPSSNSSSSNTNHRSRRRIKWGAVNGAEKERRNKNVPPGSTIDGIYSAMGIHLADECDPIRLHKEYAQIWHQRRRRLLRSQDTWRQHLRRRSLRIVTPVVAALRRIAAWIIDAVAAYSGIAWSKTKTLAVRVWDFVQWTGAKTKELVRQKPIGVHWTTTASGRRILSGRPHRRSRRFTYYLLGYLVAPIWGLIRVPLGAMWVYARVAWRSLGRVRRKRVLAVGAVAGWVGLAWVCERIFGKVGRMVVEGVGVGVAVGALAGLVVGGN
ncbi:hypothetical protein MMC21_002329 [Puttea exsequens]|nr:hypothetical protein [Puttea exsequens]